MCKNAHRGEYSATGCQIALASRLHALPKTRGLPASGEQPSKWSNPVDRTPLCGVQACNQKLTASRALVALSRLTRAFCDARFVQV